MKLKLLMGTVLSLMVVLSVQAQRPVKHPVAKKKMIQHQQAKAIHQSNMAQAIHVIKRTNKVILVAHNQVKKNKVYTGDLAKAVHHQRYAKKLLAMHKAHRAIQHSRLARMYAFQAIKQNKGMVSKEMQFNDEESKAMGENISDAELDKELKDNDPTVSYDDKTITDKDMSDLDVLEMDESDYKNE